MHCDDRETLLNGNSLKVDIQQIDRNKFEPLWITPHKNPPEQKSKKIKSPANDELETQRELEG